MLAATTSSSPLFGLRWVPPIAGPKSRSPTEGKEATDKKTIFLQGFKRLTYRMKQECYQALNHVLLTACLCIVTVSTGLFDDVFTEVGYEHYAEVPVQSFPTFLAMPFNSVINVGYLLLGCYWLLKNKKVIGNDEDVRQAHYLKDVFAGMALVYGPIQWVRIWTQTHHSAVLDQWFTLPIFAWSVVWCRYLEDGWQPWLFLSIECISLASYGLTLFHHLGFDIALACHILAAVWSAIHVHQEYGDPVSATYISLALISCLGFIVLKLGDHWLAQWPLFKELTGHFWSKICDIMQFHFAFLFLTHFSSPQRCIAEEKNI
ncbi:transmembrane protein 187 isoform X2 [Vombatus ursinus]|uniref:transmembrane protein 187 isoform X2 n=1 Tax=Vombatus ursinus TaxID=29139 RepID=UPI000FFD8B95|nr:transmembrane protein 187 isoform X2 [Vombatus ursinus]